MKIGDLVTSKRNFDIGIIFGFSLDFLINRYDNVKYKVFWHNTKSTTDTWDYDMELFNESRRSSKV